MRITGITVCVNYSDLLQRGLGRWQTGVDDLWVVTSPGDGATKRLCYRQMVHLHETEAFYRDGAEFNKAGAIDEAVIAAKPSDWVLFFDADIVPPVYWRQQVELANPRPGLLYGAHREDAEGRPIHDGELAGFFQLFHSSDPAAQVRPLLGDWHNASGYDSEFIKRWPDDGRHILPMSVRHLGEPGQNWCGRNRSDAMLRMMFERSRRGGYQHERIN